MTRVIIPPEDSLTLVRAAWQVLRTQYLQLLAEQQAGQAVEWSDLAQLFIDMNNALEATLTVVDLKETRTVDDSAGRGL